MSLTSGGGGKHPTTRPNSKSVGRTTLSQKTKQTSTAPCRMNSNAITNKQTEPQTSAKSTKRKNDSPKRNTVSKKSNTTAEPPQELSRSMSCESNTSQTSHSSDIISDGCIPISQPTLASTNESSNPPQAQALTVSSNNIGNSKDTDKNNNTTTTTQSVRSKQQINSNNNSRVARVNLNSQENLSNLPTSTRQVFLTSTETSHNIAKMNPLRIAAELDQICDKVVNVEHKSSGSLLITTHTIEQVQTLLKVTQFIDGIPVQAAVAWESHLSQGKLFAPELRDESLDNILTTLKSSGVVSIRKLFSDPRKSTVPLFVLTFLGKQCPDKITVGYSIYQIDKYIPSPLRCGKCCRWGHSGANCRSVPVCGTCGEKNHLQSDCTAIPFCINCRGNHNSFSKNCPTYLQEVEVCHLTAEQGITFSEARTIVRNKRKGNQQPAAMTTRVSSPTSAELASQMNFPNLPQQAQASSSYANSLTKQPLLVTSTNSYPVSQDNISHTLDTPWITAGQSTPLRTYNNHPEVITLNSQTPSTMLDLPSLTQPTLSLRQTPNTAPSTMKTQEQSISASEDHTFNYIKKLLQNILPSILRLFLSTTITEKIECFIEIGNSLQMNSVIADALNKMGLTSHLNS